MSRIFAAYVTIPSIMETSPIRLLLLLTGGLATHLRKGDGPRKFAPVTGSWLFVAAYLANHLGATG
jgi:hypothetical protein